MSTEKGARGRAVTNDPLATGAVLLAAVAFAGSFTHVQATVAEHGQEGWLSWAIALMPEVMVWLAVLRIRVAHRDPWSWVTLVSAGGFTVAANLAQAEPSAWGWLVAGWPAWAAISSAGMLKMGGAQAAPVRVRVKAPPKTEGPRPEPSVTPAVDIDPPQVDHGPLRAVHAPPSQVDRAERVRQLRAETGMTQAQIARELGVSLSTVKRDLAEGAA